MLRKKKTEGKLRRARLDIVDDKDQEDSSLDPITAALQERKRKQGDSRLQLLSTPVSLYRLLMRLNKDCA